MRLVLAGSAYQVESYCFHHGVSRHAVRAVTRLADLPEYPCELLLYGTWNVHADSQRILVEAFMRGWPVRDANHGVDIRPACRIRETALVCG